MDARKFHASLKEGQAQSLYWLSGEEPFLLDHALQGLRETVLGEGLAEFNCQIFYGFDCEVADVRDVVETLPMMAKRRLVVIKEAQELKAEWCEEFLPLIENPVATTTFVLISNKVDKRKKFYKALQKNGVTVEFTPPEDREIPKWIQHIAGQHGVQIVDEAVRWVHHAVGSHLATIDSEMRKLKWFIGTRSKIELADAREVLSETRLESVFELSEAIGERDRARALECLVKLLDQGQNAVGALALVTRHVRILGQVRQGIREGLRGRELSGKTGVNEYYLRKYIEQGKLWPDEKIAAAYQVLLETDRALKSSPVSDHIWLENFVIRTC